MKHLSTIQHFLTALLLTTSIVNLSTGCKSVDARQGSEILAEEDYSVRPEAVDLSSKSGNFGETWEGAKAGQVEALALFTEMYPDYEIYFLARDGEYLYDMARLLLPSQKRFHLLNVSRHTMDDEMLVDYLAQEGISEKSLKSGKKVLLVDSGFMGSIPEKIKSEFSAAARKNIKGHLLDSSNSVYPSTEVAKQHVDIGNYEGLAHYAGRSVSYAKKGGKIRVITESEDEDGTVSRKTAKAMMQDLAHYAGLQSTKNEFALRRKIWSYLRSQAEISVGTNHLQAAMQNVTNEVWGKVPQERLEAIFLDFVQILSVNAVTGKAAKSYMQTSYEKTASPPGIFKAGSSKNSYANPAPEPVVQIKKISSFQDVSLSEGETFRLAKGEYEVVEIIEDNAEYKIYKVRDSSGSLYALKTVYDESAKSIDGLAEQTASLKKLETAISNIKVVDYKKTYLLTEYVKAVRADEWIKSWAKSGYSGSKAGVKELRQLFNELADHGYYVGDLNPENLIYANKKWHIVNSGSVEKKKNREEIISRYVEKTSSRWGRVMEKISGAAGRNTGCSNLLDALEDGA
jgi:hypothetical protein